MKIPVYIVIAQWALLFVLGLLVVIIYRQLGRIFVKNSRASDSKHGPAVGSHAASLTYTRISDETLQRLNPGNGEPTLVAFVDPTCPACEDLIAALGRMRETDELAGIRALLLTADPPNYLRISKIFQTTPFEIGHITAHSGVESYNATATPLLVAVDSTGVVRAAGPAGKLEELPSFIRACTMPVNHDAHIHADIPVDQHWTSNKKHQVTPATAAHFDSGGESHNEME
jgi:hypothetical protein